MLCTTTSLYWYEPSRLETDLNGDLRPVRRAENARFDYELAHQQVPAASSSSTNRYGTGFANKPTTGVDPPG